MTLKQFVKDTGRNVIVENDNSNLFSEYRRLFISELERLEKARCNHEKRLQDLERENATLKTKVAFIGTVAGSLVTVAVNLVMKYLK